MPSISSQLTLIGLLVFAGPWVYQWGIAENGAWYRPYIIWLAAIITCMVSMHLPNGQADD